MAHHDPENAGVTMQPIEECLFGPTRKCPRVRGRVPTNETQQNTASGAALGDFLEQGGKEETRTSAYDTLHLGHWAEAAEPPPHSIDIAKLRKLASQGIADEGSPRGVAWRVLLEYLPAEDINKTWPDDVPPQRELYNTLIETYFDGNCIDKGRELRGQLSKTLRNKRLRKKYNRMQRLDDEEGGHCTSSDDDDDCSVISEVTDAPQPQADGEADQTISRIQDSLPLKFKEQWKRSGINLDKAVPTESTTSLSLGINHLIVPEFGDDSTQEDFLVFLDDAKLLEEIRKDVTRTHPDLYFFLEPQDNLGLRRYAALERILFVWAKLNKGVRYVQGMNEIVGTIYFVLANDHNSDWANYAEADTYFLFHTLMMDMRDVFVPELDSHSSGIQGRIDNMQRLLETHDPEVQEHLKEVGIDASFYAIRWLTTLLSREFLLPDTIRLWDSMFASTHKENFLRYVCGTMVMKIRDQLLKGDFSTCLRLLQRFPPSNVDAILESSRSLWIYESQITLACHKGGISLHQALQTVSPPPAIIMAFGLRGGVAPNFHDRLESAAHQVQEQVQTAKEGLLGRAKRLWTGWGSSNSDEAKVDGAPGGQRRWNRGRSNTAPAATATIPAATPPPRPRAWNRGRSTGDSEGKAKSLDITPTAALSQSENGSECRTLATLEDEVAAATGSPDRHPIWGLGAGSPSSDGATPKSEQAELGKEDNDPQTPQSSSTPTRRPIWNQGPASSGNRRGAETSDAVKVS